MRRMALAFPFQHSFFGLTPSYKPILHDEIFALIYHSHGGFNWSDVYSMPIWLRKFYIKTLIQAKDDEREAKDPSSQKNKKKPPKVITPNIR